MSNEEYEKMIKGNNDLLSINNKIEWEEAGPSEFLKSKPSSDKQDNILTFRKASTIPKTLTIVEKADPNPEGTNPNPVWSGNMIVSGTETELSAYRKV